MFKKRTINKGGQTNKQGNNQLQTSFVKRPVTVGIDLRKDIEQLQSNIKQTKKVIKNQQKYEDEERDQNNISESIALPKTKKINKFTSHILNKLPLVGSSNVRNSQQKKERFFEKEREIGEVKIEEKVQKKDDGYYEDGLVKPVLANYGLLDKSHFKSSESRTQVIQNPQNKTHQQALMDYYIRKKMEQLTKTSTPNVSAPSTTSKSNTYTLRPQRTQAWQEVLHLQKQYLTQQQKIKQYSIEQIEKKLQKQAHDIIKSQIDKRNSYLKDLLENQFERMEYASKKQLKIIKQDKQRIQKQLNSKYKDSGRRHFVESIKNSIL